MFEQRKPHQEIKTDETNFTCVISNDGSVVGFRFIVVNHFAEEKCKRKQATDF